MEVKKLEKTASQPDFHTNRLCNSSVLE
ncbi:hypothetical protein CEXT_541141, partial [Caerostris extrusa]